MTGYYHYKALVAFYPVKRYENYALRVEVLSERGTRYTVKLLGWHNDGRKPGAIMKVKKNSVRLDGAPPAPPLSIELPRRLPYKDD